MAQVQYPHDPILTKSSNYSSDFPGVAETAEQLSWSSLPQHGTQNNNDNLLVISPYTEPAHLLDLRTLEPQAALMARALTVMETTRPSDYATADYVNAFNWDQVVAKLRQLINDTEHPWRKQTFYIVVFRSEVEPTTDYPHLSDLDKAAHAEAMASGGFLKYWFGSPNNQGKNLATCLWTTRTAAKLGGVGPAHRSAAGAARDSYKTFGLERLGLAIDDGAAGWEISDWID